MDYYKTLGINNQSSDGEIKKAYRKLAMQFHPDRGGDEKKFKEIEEAYRILSDPEKKKLVDMGIDPNNQNTFDRSNYRNGPFEFHFGSNNFEDIFSNFGFGGFPGSHRRNKNVSVSVQIELIDVLKGKDIDAEISIPNGSKKIISISIPPGIENGQQIRYQGMGENSIPNLRPGDLIVNIFVRDHALYQRQGSNLIFDKKISVWDAILGTNINIDTLEGKKINILIPPGTQPDTILSCKGEGLPNIKNKIRGNLLMKIKIDIPKNLSTNEKNILENIRNARV